MADFDDRYSAATDADPFGFSDLYDKRAKLGPAPPKSEPIPGIVHGAIPGILGVDAGNIDPSSGRAMPGGPSSVDPVGAIGLWGRNSGVVDRWRHLTGQGDPKVQQDRALSDAPSRTDTPPNTPMNGGLAPPTMGQGFGPNVAGGPMGWANPGGPPPARPAAQPSPAPLGPTQPVRAPALPPPVQPQPAAQPASAPAPTAPEHDNNIIPKDSLLGRIFAGVRQQNPLLGALGGLSDFTKDNRTTLMAMAGGLAGSQSLGQGLGRAFTAAVPAMQADQAQQNQNMTANLLLQNRERLGMPNMTTEQSIAMARSPEFMKTVIPSLFGSKQFEHVMGKDMFGGETPMSFDPKTGHYFDQNGNRVGGAGEQPGIGGAPPAGVTPSGAAPYSTQSRPTLNNFNMSMVNPNIKGWDYLKQYPIEVEDAARAMMQGGAMPTGNPRQQGITTVARTAAQKVAQDLGNPDLADDTLYAERRRVRTDLGASGNSSMGGIIANGKSSFAHLADLSDKYADLGNYSGPNVPGGAWAGWAGNVAGNVVGTTPRQAGKIKAAEDNALKYGQESTKFYAGSGGGEAERMHALKGVNPRTALGTEMAEFLDTEKGLMLDRLRQKEEQIRNTLGQEFLDRHPVMTRDLQDKINRIDANIAKLRGEASGAGGERGQGPPALVKQGEHTFRVYPDGRSELVK